MPLLNPTRTNLLMLKDKVRSVTGSIGILRARRQALIKEFLDTTQPFVKSRQTLSSQYALALRTLAETAGAVGSTSVQAVCEATRRDVRVNVVQDAVWGLTFRDIQPLDSIVRNVDERGYDYRSTPVALEDSAQRFESLLAALIDIASYENKLKKLSAEILKTTRRIRVLEEKVIPEIRSQIKTIALYIAERERETAYRLKRFKSNRERKSRSP